MPKKSRYRLRFPFWLDMNKPQERELADTVEILKNERLFASTVRDGIRLICDLRAGRTDVLFELFPWIKNEMVQSTTSHPESALEVHLKRLEELIGKGGTATSIAQIPISGLKPLPKPVFEGDDQDTLIIRKDTSTDAGLNLLNSMRSLMQ